MVGAQDPGQGEQGLVKPLLACLLMGSSELPVPGVGGQLRSIPFGSVVSPLKFLIYGDCKGQSVRWEP